MRIVAATDLDAGAAAVGLLQTMSSCSGQGMEQPLGATGRERRSRTVTLGAAPLGIAGPLRGGTVVERTVHVPTAAASPSARCGGISVDYWVRAEVNTFGGQLLAGQSRVRLVSGRALYQDSEGTVLASATGACELDFDLAGPFAGRPGGVLHGRLLVRPKQPFVARRVLVFPRRVTSGVGTSAVNIWRHTDPALSRHRRRRSVTLAEQAELAGPRAFPFAVRLPTDACPTLVTPDCSVLWCLRAEVHHGRPSSNVLERQLNIYNGQ